MITSFLEDLKQRSPEEQAEYKKDRKEILEFELEAFRDLYPQDVAEVVASLTPEERLAGLEPEQIAATLTPEQLSGLSLQQRLAGLTLEQWVASLTLEQRKKLLEFLSQAENQTGEGNS